MMPEGTPEIRTLLSLMDVVEEMAWQATERARPEKRWAEIVSDVFNGHRDELRFGEKPRSIRSELEGEQSKTTGQAPRRRE